MACALKAELKRKDGTTMKFTVEVENNLKSIIEGVKKINSEISVVLTGLVDEETSLNAERGESRAQAEDEDGDDDDDDDDGDKDAAAVQLKSEPPVKRLKSVALP